MDISKKNAETALACLDGCNPCGIMKAAYEMACEVQRAEGTEAVALYPPYQLMLHKLADLAMMASLDTETFDHYSQAYRACKEAVGGNYS